MNKKFVSLSRNGYIILNNKGIMSIGNLKTEGNKGNNFPYQLRTLQLLGSINDGIAALPGVDYETRTTTYEAVCVICGPGYSTGDIIVRYDIIDVATSTLAATVWFNQTLQTTITPAPLAADLVPINAPSGVTVLNGPLTAAVNIQDGGNSITTDTTQLPATLGQTNMAGSVSVAIASNQNGVARTPNFLRPTGSIGLVAAGTYSMSFASVGTADATVGGITLKPGETLNFDAGAINNTLTGVAYNTSAVGAELIIITLT